MNLEVFDLGSVVHKDERNAALCERLANCMRDTGCVVVRDPRVSIDDNDRFLDLMERYFSQPKSQKRQQTRPELHYQVGLTPEGVEIPEAAHDPNALSDVQNLAPEHRPRIPQGPDPKCRYMWRIGPRPNETAFREFNSAPVVPDGFPEWEDTLNSWGEKLMATISTVAELLGYGLGLEDPKALTQKMRYGPHLLAPTGVDLTLHRKLDTCIAGYHADLNLLTGHGKARFPGLFIWLRNGKRVAAKIPDGCILLQAGMQLEYLTGNTL